MADSTANAWGTLRVDSWVISEVVATVDEMDASAAGMWVALMVAWMVYYSATSKVVYWVLF